MVFIHLALALIVLGMLYTRMIRRETPDRISKAQAIVPIFLGMISVYASFFLFLGLGALLLRIGYDGAKLPAVLRSISSAFFLAGLPEEVIKLVMILLTVLIFRSKVRNVYEYILIGAAVGFGFTILEEFAYGSATVAASVMRLVTIAAHMIFGIIMAKHLGTARYNKGRGAAGEYVKAILVPIALHTLYDAATATNYLMQSDNDMTSVIGIIIGFAATIIMFILQFLVLGSVKKNADRLCRMKF